jgi:hypothetical protein
LKDLPIALEIQWRAGGRLKDILSQFEQVIVALSHFSKDPKYIFSMDEFLLLPIPLEEKRIQNFHSQIMLMPQRCICTASHLESLVHEGCGEVSRLLDRGGGHWQAYMGDEATTSFTHKLLQPLLLLENGGYNNVVDVAEYTEFWGKVSFLKGC